MFPSSIRTLATIAFLLAPIGIAAGQDVVLEVYGGATVLKLRAVAGCGDLDGDGRDDLVVGTASATTINGQSGLARLVSGQDGHTIYESIGEHAGAAHGKALAGVGHFNGDNVPDFAVGAHNDSSQGPERGRVTVYSGADGSSIVVLIGTEDYAHLGWSVAGIGDVNQDGFDDLLVGQGTAGRARVYLGPSGELRRTHEGELTRLSVAGVGDMDQDGVPDYIVGWPQDSSHGLYTGRASVFSGRDGELIHTVFGEIPHQGSTTGDHLGLSVSGAGDVNGDGVLDFMAGLPGEIELWYGATQCRVRVYSGVDASILWELNGEEFTTGGGGTQFGHRVAGGEDLNADGFSDFLVGAPLDTILSTEGSVCVFSGKEAALLWKRYGEVGGNQMGSDCAMLEDMNQDGLSDFAIGNGATSQNFQYEGSVTVSAGAIGGIERHCTAAPNSAGPGARIDISGPISVGNNGLTLLASGAIPSQTGLFYYGPNAIQLPFGDGWRCVGGSVFRLGPPLVIEQDGTADRPLDFTQPPLSSGPGAIDPGSTWSFQFWYRDPSGPGGSTFNLSDAVRIQFTP